MYFSGTRYVDSEKKNSIDEQGRFMLNVGT